jgi:hypothetical protein
VPLQGSLAVAGRRGAESWGGGFPRQRAGSPHPTTTGPWGRYRVTWVWLRGGDPRQLTRCRVTWVWLQGSDRVNPLQGNLGVATG